MTARFMSDTPYAGTEQESNAFRASIPEEPEWR